MWSKPESLAKFSLKLEKIAAKQKNPTYRSYTVAVEEEDIYGVQQSVVYTEHCFGRVTLSSFKTDAGRSYLFARETHNVMHVAEKCQLRRPHQPTIVDQLHSEIALPCIRDEQYYEKVFISDTVGKPVRSQPIEADFRVSQSPEAKLYLRCTQWTSVDCVSCTTAAAETTFETGRTSSVSLALPSTRGTTSCSSSSLWDVDVTKSIAEDDEYVTDGGDSRTYTLQEPRMIGNLRIIEARQMAGDCRPGAQTVCLDVQRICGTLVSDRTSIRTYDSELVGVGDLFEEGSSPELEKPGKRQPCEDVLKGRSPSSCKSNSYCGVEQTTDGKRLSDSVVSNKSSSIKSNRRNSSRGSITSNSCCVVENKIDSADWDRQFPSKNSSSIDSSRRRMNSNSSSNCNRIVARKTDDNRLLHTVVSNDSRSSNSNCLKLLQHQATRGAPADIFVSHAEPAQASAVACGDRPMEGKITSGGPLSPKVTGPRRKGRTRFARIFTRLICCYSFPPEEDGHG